MHVVICGGGVIGCELGSELAKHDHQAQIWLQELGVFRPQAGRIHSELGRPPLEYGQYFVCHLRGDVDLGLNG